MDDLRRYPGIIDKWTILSSIDNLILWKFDTNWRTSNVNRFFTKQLVKVKSNQPANWTFRRTRRTILAMTSMPVCSQPRPGGDREERSSGRGWGRWWGRRGGWRSVRGAGRDRGHRHADDLQRRRRRAVRWDLGPQRTSQRMFVEYNGIIVLSANGCTHPPTQQSPTGPVGLLTHSCNNNPAPLHSQWTTPFTMLLTAG